MLLLLCSLVPCQGSAPLANGLVREIELEPRPGTLVQHFRLDAEPAAAGGEAKGRMRYVTGPDPEGGLRVELEIQYFDHDLRVIHTELASAEHRLLVFRELFDRGGRTLFLSGAPATGYESYELGGPEIVRHALDGTGEFPLLWIEAARRGHEVPATLPLLEPLSSRFEPAFLEETSRDGTRQLTARREDGSRRWCVSFRDGLPVEWRWQDRAPVARAISREEYEQLGEEHEPESHAVREAASSRERSAHPARAPRGH